MKTIPQDKANHVVLGALVALAGLMLGVLWAAAACAAAALGREAYNRASGGAWSWADIACTGAGGAIVLLASVVGTAGLAVA